MNHDPSDPDDVRTIAWGVVLLPIILLAVVVLASLMGIE